MGLVPEALPDDDLAAYLEQSWRIVAGAFPNSRGMRWD